MNLETYQATIAGRVMDLTYMEYELLRFLATNPHRVFTRETLLSRVWGYEYYGGARTVDVHVRRLRAKLGEEHAHLIQTVRSSRLQVRPSSDARGDQARARRPRARPRRARRRGSWATATAERVGRGASNVSTQTSLHAAKSAMSTRKRVALTTWSKVAPASARTARGVDEGLAQLVGRGALDEGGRRGAGHEPELARDDDEVTRAPPGRVGADRGAHGDSAEGVAAAAGARGVGVGDVEPRALEPVGVVERRAGQQVGARGRRRRP